MLVTFEVRPNAKALQAASQGLVALGRLYLAEGNLPPLYDSGVLYHAEPRGRERWLSADQVFHLGRGDCEDLTNYRVAELQLRGEFAKSKIIKTGRRKFHALVQRGDGSYEDPSIRLGMKVP